MNKKIVLLLITVLTSTVLYSQTQNPVLMKIKDRPVTKSEFEYLYHKNNTSSQQSLDEYLKLFIDYKLKVEEAITQGLDTTKTFLSEYNNYKNQLIQPYLLDTISEQIIAKKLYDRLGENLEVSHILIRLPSDRRMLPKDTLAAYEKAISLRNELFGKKAKSFEEVAIGNSEDPSVSQTDRPGYLGWATSMMFVSPFENGMYSTNVGEVSMPVRSMFGYHLIKVHARRPDPGKMDVAHIMISFPQRNPTEAQRDSVKKIAEEVYSKLKSGSDYAELSEQYSSDRASADKGGNLGWIQTGTRYPREFMDAAFTLKNAGDITTPVETAFGFHIIKLNEKEGRESWAEAKDKIVRQIGGSDLGEEVYTLKMEKLTKGINYQVDKNVYNSLLALTSTYFPLDSTSLSLTSIDNRTLLTIGDKKYSVADFTKYMEQNGNFRYNLSSDFLIKSFEKYILDNKKEAYIASLPSKYPEYNNLLREYHDGILLFNVMNEEVWEKAAKDTLGLTKYFNENKSKYKWDSPRYKGRIIYCKDEATLKAAKGIAGKNKNESDLDAILKSSLNTDSTSVVFSRKGVWAKGDNQFIDVDIFKVKGIEPEPIKNYPYYFIQGKQINSPEEYTDVKGMVVSDYQEYREKEWIQSLRDKFIVEIDEKVLETIK